MSTFKTIASYVLEHIENSIVILQVIEKKHLNWEDWYIGLREFKKSGDGSTYATKNGVTFIKDEFYHLLPLFAKLEPFYTPFDQGRRIVSFGPIENSTLFEIKLDKKENSQRMELTAEAIKNMVAKRREIYAHLPRDVCGNEKPIQ